MLLIHIGISEEKLPALEMSAMKGLPRLNGSRSGTYHRPSRGKTAIPSLVHTGGLVVFFAIVLTFTQISL